MTKNKNKTIVVDQDRFLNTLNYINVCNMSINMMQEKAKLFRARVIFFQEVIAGDTHAETEFSDWLNNTFLTKKNVVRKKYRTHLDFQDHSDERLFELRESVIRDGILDERYIPKDDSIKKMSSNEYMMQNNINEYYDKC